MQFTFDSGVKAVGWSITIPFDGYNVSTEGTEVTEVNFTIPELRQMLADAEMAAAEFSDCDCRLCGGYAPLASEEELAQDFEDRASADASAVLRVEELLSRAEKEAANTSDLIQVAYARKDLLGG